MELMIRVAAGQELPEDVSSSVVLENISSFNYSEYSLVSLTQLTTRMLRNTQTGT